MEEEPEISVTQKYEEKQKPTDIPTLFNEISKHSILNYILKNLSIRLNEAPILKEDLEFNKKCISLSWIQPENMLIKEEICDDDIFEEIIEHIKKIDDLRAPEEMLKEFGLAVQLINSLFVFMLDKTDSDSDSFTSILIYTIIKSKPKRLCFNIKFIK